MTNVDSTTEPVEALTVDMLIYGYGEHKRIRLPSGLCSCGHDDGLGKQFSTHVVNEFLLAYSRERSAPVSTLPATDVWATTSGDEPF